MANDVTICITGNLVDDPILRFPSDDPPARVHLTAATLDAAAAVCEVRGLPHLVARLDRAANEIRSQEDIGAA